MKRLLLLSITLLFIGHLQAQRFDWLKVYSSSGFSSNDLATAVVGNNVFVAGEFRGTVSFGSTVLNAPASNIQQIYLANYDTLGNFRWATNGGSPTGFANFLDLDVDQFGNVYILGNYNVSFQWGSVTMNSSGGGGPFSNEGFIVKLNSNGVAQWVEGVFSPNGSISTNSLSQISVKNNSIYFGGILNNDLSLTNSSLRLLQPNFQNDAYVGRLDTSGSFNLLERVFNTSQTSGTSFLLSDLEALSDSTYYVCGILRGNYSLGSNNVSYNSSLSNIYLSQFTNSNCDWLSTSTSAVSFFSSNPQIDVSNGDIFMGGSFSSNLNFQGRNIVTGLTSPFATSWFAAKFDASGSIQELVPVNVSSSTITDIAVNNKSELFLVGSYIDSINFAGKTILSNGSSDILVLNFDSNLNENWLQVGGGGNSDGAISIATDNSSNVYSVSNFRGLSQFGSSFFTGSNAFNTSIIKKLSECGNAPVSLSFNGDTNLCAGQFVRIQANLSTLGTFQWLKDSIPLTGEIFRDLIIDSSGNYQVIVNSQGCVDTSRAVPVNVGLPPTVIYNQVDTVCEQAAPIPLVGGLPTGGFYRGNGVVNNTFDPSLTGIGNQQVWYIFSNGGCLDSAASNIFVEPAPTAFFAPIPDVCVNSSPVTLTNAFPPGGTFSGNGVNGNQFDPASAGSGLTTISYTYTAQGGCSVTVDQQIQVDTLETVSFNSVADLCLNSSPIALTEGTPAGGNYSGVGVSNGIFDPSISGVGTFTLTYSFTNQCGTSSGSQTITVLPAPTVNLGIFNDLCEGDAAIALSGGSPSGGIYSGLGVAAGNFDPAVSGVGTFSIFYTYTDGQGCANLDSSTITVNPLPQSTITPDTNICLGSSITLNVSGGSTYLWSNNATAAAISVSPTITTTYSVTVTNANNCSTVENVLVTVNPLPTASISGNTTICEGSSTTLTASGGQFFNWSNGASTSTTTVAPSQTTTYTVTVSDANGCSDTESVTVNVNSLPIVNLGTFNDLCEDDAAIALSGGSPSGGTYSGVGVTVGNFDPAVSGVGTFSIFYTYTDGQGCANLDSSTITVNPLPQSTITPDTNICLGSSITLNVSGGSTYLWSNNATAAAISVSPTITTTYSVTVTNANNCSTVENVLVTVNPLPTASISGNTTICEGSSTTLTASGGQFFNWSNGASTSTTTVAPSQTTTYTVTVSDANGCSDTESITVNVNSLPTVNLNTFNDLCEGDAAIVLSGGSPSGGTYSGVGVTVGNFDPAVSGVGTFSIFYNYTDGQGCSNLDSSTISVKALPQSTITPDTSICLGSSIILSASGGSSYLWNNNATTTSILVSPTTTTNYSVTVSNANNCSTVENVTVTVNPLPQTSISADTSICIGGSAVLSVNSSSTNFQWSSGQATSQITVSPLVTTTYFVTTTANQQCIAIDSVTVTVNSGSSISIGPDVTLDPLNNPTITYDAGAGFSSYLWQDGSTAQTLTVNYDPAKAGSTDTINVRAIDASTCPYLDTAFVFFDVISSLDNPSEEAAFVSISPNPTVDMLKLSFNQSSNQERVVQLYDLKGKLVLRQTIGSRQGEFILNLPRASISKGVYLIQIEEENQFYTEKVVVQ